MYIFVGTIPLFMYLCFILNKQRIKNEKIEQEEVRLEKIKIEREKSTEEERIRQEKERIEKEKLEIEKANKEKPELTIRLDSMVATKISVKNPENMTIEITMENLAFVLYNVFSKAPWQGVPALMFAKSNYKEIPIYSNKDTIIAKLLIVFQNIFIKVDKKEKRYNFKVWYRYEKVF